MYDVTIHQRIWFHLWHRPMTRLWLKTAIFVLNILIQSVITRSDLSKRSKPLQISPRCSRQENCESISRKKEFCQSLKVTERIDGMRTCFYLLSDRWSNSDELTTIRELNVAGAVQKITKYNASGDWCSTDCCWRRSARATSNNPSKFQQV